MSDNFQASPVPPYVALDVWVAIGLDSQDFDPYFERNGWATTWAQLLAAIRPNRPPCHARVDADDFCVFDAGHSGPHYGRGDVGVSEPLPWSVEEPS